MCAGMLNPGSQKPQHGCSCNDTFFSRFAAKRTKLCHCFAHPGPICRRATKEHMDAEDIFVTDKSLGVEKMDDIAARAGRFAEIVRSRHGSQKTSFMATLGAIGQHHHHHRFIAASSKEEGPSNAETVHVQL